MEELERLLNEATPGPLISDERQTVKRILDPCCGSRMFWFDRDNPDVVFGDIRSETITVTDRSHGREDGTRTLHIAPDEPMDFRAIPYPDESFWLVVFDPPHIVRAGPRSWLAAKYGKLSQDWREDLRQGFAECFRVLKPNGTLIFKWNETQIPVRDVVALAPQPPLFGHVSGRKSQTHWLVFMKDGSTAIITASSHYDVTCDALAALNGGAK